MLGNNVPIFSNWVFWLIIFGVLLSFASEEG